jgi:hypothetical protein
MFSVDAPLFYLLKLHTTCFDLRESSSGVTNTHSLSLSRVVDSTYIHFQHYDVLLLTVSLRHIIFFTLIYILYMGLFI